MAIESNAIRRLAAMEIQVWQSRAPKPVEAADAPSESVAPGDAVPVGDSSTEAVVEKPRSRPARIRLEAGSGCWLLVVDDADRARHAALIEDIRAVLGTGDCRFGTWSESADAGVAAADGEAHGIRHALVFGGEDGPGVIQGGPLDRLASSGEARRALWRQLQPVLGR